MEKNHEVYLKPEVSKLLREIGFEWEGKLATQNNDGTYQFYPDSPTQNWNNENNVANGYMVTCPSLYVAQMFLRENKNIEIFITFGYKPKSKKRYYYVKEIWDKNTDDVYAPPHKWTPHEWGNPEYVEDYKYVQEHLLRGSYENALEEAIYLSCKHILNPDENVWDFEEKTYDKYEGTFYEDN